MKKTAKITEYRCRICRRRVACSFMGSLKLCKDCLANRNFDCIKPDKFEDSICEYCYGGEYYGGA